MNEASEVTVMKIMTANTSMMDDDAKAWYKMAWACILQEMNAAAH
jgi:hypothetical protein